MEHNTVINYYYLRMFAIGMFIMVHIYNALPVFIRCLLHCGE